MSAKADRFKHIKNIVINVFILKVDDHLPEFAHVVSLMSELVELVNLVGRKHSVVH